MAHPAPQQLLVFVEITLVLAGGNQSQGPLSGAGRVTPEADLDAVSPEQDEQRGPAVGDHPGGDLEAINRMPPSRDIVLADFYEIGLLTPRALVGPEQASAPGPAAPVGETPRARGGTRRIG